MSHQCRCARRKCLRCARRRPSHEMVNRYGIWSCPFGEPECERLSAIREAERREKERTKAEAAKAAREHVRRVCEELERERGTPPAPVPAHGATDGGKA